MRWGEVTVGMPICKAHDFLDSVPLVAIIAVSTCALAQRISNTTKSIKIFYADKP